jgi:methyl-accepting chemotaxis protein
MAAQAPAGNPSALSTHDSQLAGRVKDLSQLLRKRGAKNGARRLEEVSQQFQHFTVEGASQYIRKDEIIDEIEDRGPWWLSGLTLLRNLLSIAPIAFTWYALHVAADAYDKDLADPRYRDDLYQPFLRLWQDGFHGNHGSVIPFSWAAGFDAILLSLMIILAIFLIPWLQRWHKEQIHKSLESFDTTIDDLLSAIGQSGANAHLADSDIDKIAQAIQGTLQKVLLNYDRVAGEARKFIENTHQSTQTLLKNFEDNLAVFNSDVKLLTSDVQRINTDLNSYGQKLSELTDASNKLATSSNDLALNAKSMADSANLSSQASQGISSQLKALNDTQAEIIKAQKDVVQEISTTQKNVVQEISTTQKNVVQEISGVADDMEESSKNTRDVAAELEKVVKDLKQFTQADLQRMTGEVIKAANQVDRVAAGLGQIATASQTLLSTISKAQSQQNSSRSLFNRVAMPAAALATLTIVGELVALILRMH